MSKNINQIYIANPITSNTSTDLMYFGQSPYGAGNDAGMLYSNFSAQFATPLQIQRASFNYSNDTGTDGTEYIATLTPAITSLTDGLIVIITPAHTNTVTNPTLTVPGASAKFIKIAGNNIISIGDIKQFQVAIFYYSDDDGVFYLLNPANALNCVENSINGQFNYAADTGSANTYVAENSFLPDLTDTGGLVAGTYVFLKVANSNSGASTLNYGSTSATAILSLDGNPLTSGMMVAGGISLLQFDGTNWQLLNPVSSGGGGSVTPTDVQENAFNSGIDSGVADAYDVALTPAITSPYPNMIVSFTPANGSIAGNCTLALNSGTPLPILRFNGEATSAFDISGAIPCFVQATVNADSWQLINPNTVGLYMRNVVEGTTTYYTDLGTADAYVANGADTFYQPTLAALPGTSVYLLVSNTNDGASTLDFNAVGASAINYNGNPLVGNEMIAGRISILVYDGSSWNLINNYAVGTIASSVIPVASAVSLTSTTIADITSLDLNAGVWEVTGNIFFTASVGAQEIDCWSSDTSATQPDDSLINANTGTFTRIGMSVPSVTYTLPTDATIYLSGSSTFVTGTVTACGGIYATRIS